jgi:hypothetical protein
VKGETGIANRYMDPVTINLVLIGTSSTIAKGYANDIADDSPMRVWPPVATGMFFAVEITIAPTTSSAAPAMKNHLLPNISVNLPTSVPPTARQRVYTNASQLTREGLRGLPMSFAIASRKGAMKPKPSKPPMAKNPSAKYDPINLGEM